MVFDAVHTPTTRVIAMVVDHLRLWVVRASSLLVLLILMKYEVQVGKSPPVDFSKKKNTARTLT
jgi:hypothetical protein